MRLRPEGAGDFPVFAHAGLLIWASCSMAVAQGIWSVVWSCVGWTQSHDSSLELEDRGWGHGLGLIGL